MKLKLAAVAVAALVGNTATAQENLTGATSDTTGVPGMAMLHLGEVAAREGIANLQIASGQTLTNVIQSVAEGSTDVGATPFILAFLLSKGAGPYAAIGAEKGAELAGNVSVLYTYTLGCLGLYAFDSVGLDRWDDLKGRNVLNGPPRGAALTNSRNLTQLVTGYKDGVDYAGVQANWGQMAHTITDGSADAMVLPISFPDARITPALASGDMSIFSVPKDIYESESFQKFLRAPGAAPCERPRELAEFSDGVTLVSEDDTFRGIATVGGHIVNSEMGFEMAKALTAVHIATMDELKSRAPVLSAAGLDNEGADTGMCGANPLKYHAGAVAAWEEAGYTIPDCAKS